MSVQGAPDFARDQLSTESGSRGGKEICRQNITCTVPLWVSVLLFDAHSCSVLGLPSSPAPEPRRWHSGRRPISCYLQSVLPE